MQLHAEYIEKAIAGLTALRDRRITSSVNCQEDEVASFIDARAVAKEAHLICASLLIDLCEIAADRSGKMITETDRRNFRDAHLIDDALFDADQWADQMTETLGAEPEYSTLNVAQQGTSSAVARV